MQVIQKSRSLSSIQLESVGPDDSIDVPYDTAQIRNT